MRIGFAADHAGAALKAELIRRLRSVEGDHELVDLGWLRESGTYLPVWSSTGSAPSVGDGSLTGRWARTGKVVHFWILLLFGSTTSVGSGIWNFTLPAAAEAPAAENTRPPMEPPLPSI